MELRRIIVTSLHSQLFLQSSPADGGPAARQARRANSRHSAAQKAQMPCCCRGQARLLPQLASLQDARITHSFPACSSSSDTAASAAASPGEDQLGRLRASLAAHKLWATRLQEACAMQERRLHQERVAHATETQQVLAVACGGAGHARM